MGSLNPGGSVISGGLEALIARVSVKLNGNFSVANDDVYAALHYIVQFDNVVHDPSGLFTAVMTAQDSTIGSYGIAAGGTGYAVGDIVEINGGTPTITTRVRVAAVSGGAITAFDFTGAARRGEYASRLAPTNPVTTTAVTGVGVNASFLMEYSGSTVLVPSGAAWCETRLNVAWAANATGYRQCATRKGLYTSIAGGGQSIIPVNSAASGTTQAAPSGRFSVTPGEIITANVRQNSGGALNVLSGPGSTFDVSFFSA